MPRRCIAICCSLLLIEWLAGCSADDRLAWKPRPGADYRLLIDITDSDILRSGDTIFRIRHTYDLTLQLQRQEKNRYFMDVVINDILIEQPGRRVKLKSGDSIWLTGLGPEPPFSFSTKGVPPEVENNKDYKTELKEYYKEHLKLFSKLSGAKLQVVMDHKGQVKEVIGAEEFTKRIFAGIALDPNVAHGLLLFYEPGKFITELLNNAFFFLPGQKIEKDEQRVG
jgi:hypothetical protein